MDDLRLRPEILEAVAETASLSEAGGLLAPFLVAEHTYVPHLTVGRLATHAYFHTALADARRAADTLGPIEAEVRAISSYLIAANGPGTIECTIRL